MTANRTIVSQPANVISKLLPANQGVKEVGDDQQRDDEPKYIGCRSCGRSVRRDGAKLSYAIDSLDDEQQDREHCDPENDGDGVHATTIRHRPSRSHDDLATRHNDFVTVDCYATPRSGSRRRDR